MQRLGYTFGNPSLLTHALCHPSCGGEHFQRLEFLGDRVLGLIMAQWIYQQFPLESEGELSKRLSNLVNRHTLARVGEQWNIAAEMQCVTPGKGAVADGVEALLGAIFLDGGLEAARQIIATMWQDQERHTPPTPEPKTALQERTQHLGKGLPRYCLVNQTGPSHQPVFTVRVDIDPHFFFIGQGPSKQKAEQQAASLALAALKSADR